MGDEKKDWDFWLDEYNNTMADSGLTVGDVTIDLSDYYSGADDVITVGNYDEWFKDLNTHDNITLTGGGEEMLRVAEDGFYVRGIKVEADAKEAEQVYKAFKQWLTWATLSKNPDE